MNHFATIDGGRPGTVAFVASDKPDAGALRRADARGIERATLVDAADGPAMLATLREREIDTVALAGYLQYVPTDVTRAYRGRLVNVHPSLLPAFGGRGMYGSRVHRAAIAAGVRISGATVHFVDDEYDHGPIIAQMPVPVFPSDDATQLAARVLRAEHVLFPLAIEAIVAGRVTLTRAGRVEGSV